MPHRIEGAWAAAVFIRTSLRKTSQGCSGLLLEIESTFSQLALESDPDQRFCTEGNAPAEIKTFCQQYCVLLAYQTIYQCYLNHVAAIINVVESEVKKLHILR